MTTETKAKLDQLFEALDLDVKNYNVPFLLNPFLSLYTSRGCPAMCTFCLWPQTHSGHRWRLRSSDDIVNEVKYIRDNFPERYALKDVDGIINPDHIAEAYWMLHNQPRDAWTHELDLRPWMEKF